MRGLLFLMVVALGGCSSMDPIGDRNRLESEINIAPGNYRSDIVAAMRTYLNDPSNVRDAYVSEPALKDFGGGTRYLSCVRYNAKKSNGQYAGSKDSAVAFRSGRLDRIVDSAREQCKDAAYVRFPELEQMSR